MHAIFHSRQVFLGRKKGESGDKSGMLYAIKSMKKTELVKKNMIDQGEKQIIVCGF